FIVIVNRTTTNWKAYAESREREIKGLTISLDTDKETIAQERSRRIELENQLKAGAKGSVEELDKLKDQNNALSVQNANARQEVIDADLRAKKAQEDVKGHKQLADDRLKIIGEREAVILKKEADYREAKKNESALREERDRLQLRAEALQDEY